jgi:hypothetical protein
MRPTAITHERFKALFVFLHPENFSLEYEKGRTDIKQLSNEDGLFLTLVRQRHNFGLKDHLKFFWHIFHDGISMGPDR